MYTLHFTLKLRESLSEGQAVVVLPRINMYTVDCMFILNAHVSIYNYFLVNLQIQFVRVCVCKEGSFVTKDR